MIFMAITTKGFHAYYRPCASHHSQRIIAMGVVRLLLLSIPELWQHPRWIFMHQWWTVIMVEAMVVERLGMALIVYNGHLFITTSYYCWLFFITQLELPMVTEQG